jgi:hypothetical protein
MGSEWIAVVNKDNTLKISRLKKQKATIKVVELGTEKKFHGAQATSSYEEQR